MEVVEYLLHNMYLEEKRIFRKYKEKLILHRKICDSTCDSTALLYGIHSKESLFMFGFLLSNLSTK